MWQTNILMQHQPMNYCQHTIHPIDCQQNNPAEIFRTDYQHTDQKEDHESNANRTYIPRKTLCLFPEIEEVKNKKTPFINANAAITTNEYPPVMPLIPSIKL